MATIVFIGAFDSGPRGKELLDAGSELAKLCRTVRDDPKTADFSRLLFLIADGGSAYESFRSLTSGVSSTWNPKPGQFRNVYAQDNGRRRDYAAIVEMIAKEALDDKIVAVISERKGMAGIFLQMQVSALGIPRFVQKCIDLSILGFTCEPGEMAIFDADSGDLSTFDPHAAPAVREQMNA